MPSTVAIDRVHRRSCSDAKKREQLYLSPKFNGPLVTAPVVVRALKSAGLELWQRLFDAASETCGYFAARFRDRIPCQRSR
jgi:hypothetical protein